MFFKRQFTRFSERVPGRKLTLFQLIRFNYPFSEIFRKYLSVQPSPPDLTENYQGLHRK